MCRESNRLLKIKIIKEKRKKWRKKENRKKKSITPQNCKIPPWRQTLITTVKHVTEEKTKTLKSLIRFHRTNKIDNYIRGRKVGGDPKSSPPGSSLQGICQARVLEWVAIAFS